MAPRRAGQTPVGVRIGEGIGIILVIIGILVVGAYSTHPSASSLRHPVCSPQPASAASNLQPPACSLQPPPASTSSLPSLQLQPAASSLHPSLQHSAYSLQSAASSVLLPATSPQSAAPAFNPIAAAASRHLQPAASSVTLLLGLRGMGRGSVRTIVMNRHVLASLLPSGNLKCFWRLVDEAQDSQRNLESS